MITGMSVALAPVVEFRPAPIEQPSRVTGSCGVILRRCGVAEAGGDMTCEAVAICCGTDGKAYLARSYGNFPHHRRGDRTDRDDEMSGREVAFEPPSERGNEAQVDVIPEDGGVVFRQEGDSGKTAGVGVTLDDLDASRERGGMEQPGELAKATTEVRDEAAGAELATGGEAAPTRGAPELFPEAEDLTGRDF